jgi:hypothetical protein
LFLEKSRWIPTSAIVDFIEAVTLDSVDIGYRRLRGEGKNVGGAYAEVAVTSYRRQTGRGAAGGSDARLGGGGRAGCEGG